MEKRESEVALTIWFGREWLSAGFLREGKIGYEVLSRSGDYNGGYMDLRWKRGYYRSKVRGFAVQVV